LKHKHHFRHAPFSLSIYSRRDSKQHFWSQLSLLSFTNQK